MTCCEAGAVRTHGPRWKRGLRAVGEADDLVDGIEAGRFHDIGGHAPARDLVPVGFDGDGNCT